MGFGIGSLIKTLSAPGMFVENLAPKSVRKFGPTHLDKSLRDFFVTSFKNTQGGGSAPGSSQRAGIGHRHGRFEKPHSHEGDK